MTIAAATTASETLELKHHFNARPEQVFAAWSEPEALNQWFGPHSHNCKVEKFDFKTGGKYQIRMIPTGKVEDPDCHGDTTQDSVCAGEFVEIEKPNKIVMTFNWIQNGADMGETLLSIHIYPANDGTDLVLTHEKIPTEELREAHQGGWQGSLECLEEYLIQA
jgi:uncharacterized protein YndB with AHSA1/START domain